MKIKKVFLVAFVGILGISAANAQNFEVGLSSSANIGFGFGSFYDSNLMLKWGGDKIVQRIRIPQTYYNHSTYQGQTYTNMSTGLFYGVEWRKPLSDKFQFTQAAVLGANINVGTNYEAYSPSVRYLLGVRYQPIPRLALSMEVPSSIATSFSKANGTWQDNRNISAGLFNAPGLFSITYDLKKK